jgi:hypothetical protein
MRQIAIVSLLTLVAGLGSLAKADIWSFTQGTASVNYGVGSKSFTSTGGVTITAYGYNNAGTLGGPANTYYDLYGKYTTGDPTETGLGFANEIDHEIDNTGYIELDLNNIADGTLLSLAVGSIQTGESYNLYKATVQGGTSAGGANPGGNLSLLVANPPSDTLTNSPFLFTKTASFRYIAVEAQAADVLIGSLSSVAPEPGYYAVLLIGVAGLAGVAIRRRRLAQSA